MLFQRTALVWLASRPEHGLTHLASPLEFFPMNCFVVKKLKGRKKILGEFFFFPPAFSNYTSSLEAPAFFPYLFGFKISFL